jgi:hypothetical protein
MQQQQRLEMVEFGVTGLAEVRTLLSRWKQVLVELGREEAPSMVMKTYRQVGVEVEDRAARGGGPLDLPGPQGSAGEVPGRPQAAGAGGL